MAKSVEEQIADTQAALEAVQRHGQRNAVSDREVWRADASALEARLERLERKADRQKNGGVRTTRIIPL